MDSKKRKATTAKETHNPSVPGTKQPSNAKRKERGPAQVFQCPSAFPRDEIPHRKKRRVSSDDPTVRDPKQVDDSRKKAVLLDFHQAAKEVRELGSTTFTGYQRKLHLEAKYQELTGKEAKRQKRPVKILWGMERKQARQRARTDEEARTAGIVTPRNGEAESKKQKEEKEQKRYKEMRKSRSLYGPAPTVGFMTHGMLRVNKKDFK